MRILMMATVFITLVNPITSMANDSQSLWATYRSFLTSPACGVVSDTEKCEKALMSWRRDFMWATDPTMGDLVLGQENVAYCLFSGCDGAVKTNAVLACAWVRVMLLSGHANIQEKHFAFGEEVCNSLDSQMKKDAAAAQAERLIAMIKTP